MTVPLDVDGVATAAGPANTLHETVRRDTDGDVAGACGTSRPGAHAQ